MTVNIGQCYDSTHDGLIDKIARLRASHAELLAVAKRFFIVEELDYPGDGPRSCGYECLLCQGSSDLATSIRHLPGCAIANAEKV